MQIKAIYAPTYQQLEPLASNFQTFMESRISGLAPESEDKTFVFYAQEDSQMIAGISGNVYWNGLSIDTLWVEENFRGSGIGTRLITQAEKYAIENNAVIAYLKTTDATGFYKKLSYSVFGELEDRPIGTVLYHMKKRLDSK